MGGSVPLLQSNNLRGHMFWNYCLASGFFCPEMYSIVPIPQQPMIPLQNQPPPEISHEIICLTAEDHIKAGYEKNKTPWTEEEDKTLKHLRDQKSWEWDQIAQQLPGRNAKMCYSRYKRLQYNPREHWKKSQDENLKKLVRIHGEDWGKVASYFKKRSTKQVKDHYENYLKESINHQAWSMEEDMRLVELLNLHGRNWRLIEETMEGRTQNQIKNRFFGRIKKLNDKKVASLPNPT